MRLDPMTVKRQDILGHLQSMKRSCSNRLIYSYNRKEIGKLKETHMRNYLISARQR